jgi:hypothetical protein
MKGNSIGAINSCYNFDYFSISNLSNNKKSKNNDFNKDDLGEDFIFNEEKELPTKEKILEVLNLEEFGIPKNYGNQNCLKNEFTEEPYNSHSVRENTDKLNNKSSFSQNLTNQQIIDLLNEDKNQNETIKANKLKSKTIDLLENIFGRKNISNNNIACAESNFKNNNNNNYNSNSVEKEKINFILNPAQTKNNKNLIEGNSAEKVRYPVTENNYANELLEKDHTNSQIIFKNKNDLDNDDKIYIKSLDFDNIENENDIFDFVKKEKQVSKNLIPFNALFQQNKMYSNSLENNFVIRDNNIFKQNLNAEANFIEIKEQNIDIYNNNAQESNNKISFDEENIIAEFNENRKNKTIENPNETNNEVLITSENESNNKSEFVLGKNSTKIPNDFPKNLIQNSTNFEYNEFQRSKYTENNNNNAWNENKNVTVKNPNDNSYTDNNRNVNMVINNDINNNFDENNFISEYNSTNKDNNLINTKSEGILKAFNNENNKANLISKENIIEKSVIILEIPKFSSNTIIINGNDNIIIDNNANNKGKNEKNLMKISEENSVLNTKNYEKLNTQENKNEVSIYDTNKNPELDLITIESDYNRDERTNQIDLGTESARNSNLFTEKCLNNQLQVENSSEVIIENQEVEIIDINENEKKNNNEKINFVNNNYNENNVKENLVAENAEVNTENFNSYDLNNFNYYVSNLNTNNEIINNNVFIENANSNLKNNSNYNSIATSKDTELNRQINQYDGNYTTHDTNLILNNQVLEKTSINNSVIKINLDSHNKNENNKLELSADKK